MDNENNYMIDHIEKAIGVLSNGGIVIFPTDTAFGIGCRIDNPRAVEKLFSIRERPKTQPMPVLCSSIDMVAKYVDEIPDAVKQELMTEYWPGALTIVLPAKEEKVPHLVRGGGNTVGVRIPNHEVPLSLIKGTGVPILGSSANFHGGQTPYDLVDINPELIYLTDYIIPGMCTLCRESTVIDCSVMPWKILRHGAIAIDVASIKQSLIPPGQETYE